MMAGGVESWSPSPSPPEGRGEGKMVVVGGEMVMDFPLDDFRPPLLLRPFSAQIASQASPETVGV